MMKKKMFICSDIHGYYNEMKKALEDAGYDENNNSHLLVVVGDTLDRGNFALTTYEYLKSLMDNGKAIILHGNHDKFFIDFLEGSVSPFNYLHNGTNETIADFWHRSAPFESWCALEGNCDLNQINYAKWVDICRKDIQDEYPELLPWLKSLPRYFETKNYIMTHGAIDTKVEDWHNPHCYRYSLADWDALDFNDGSFFGETIGNTDKTVIIGHFGTRFLREMYDYPIEKGHEDDILTRNDGRVIAIDATTAASHKVNVLVLEDELLDE